MKTMIHGYERKVSPIDKNRIHRKINQLQIQKGKKEVDETHLSNVCNNDDFKLIAITCKEVPDVGRFAL